MHVFTDPNIELKIDTIYILHYNFEEPCRLLVSFIIFFMNNYFPFAVSLSTTYNSKKNRLKLGGEMKTKIMNDHV